MILAAASTDSGKRLDWFLHERLPEFSRSRLQSWIKDERVLVDGKPARASYSLRGSESISVSPAEFAPLRAEAEEIPLHILYEDPDVVAIDKPAGMVVHAGFGHRSGTVVNALLHRFGSLSSVNGDIRPGIVHRLDKETSGVLVIARTDKAHLALARQFHDREVEKIYFALVHGQMKEPKGRITAPIARDPVHRTRMTARLGSGRPALTEYEVIEDLERFSYMRINLGTGRTHQIRVHLSSIRHPIVGDRLYGAPAIVPGLAPLGRFFLHAHRLRFQSPATGEPVVVKSPLPSELARFLESLRSNAARI